MPSCPSQEVTTVGMPQLHHRLLLRAHRARGGKMEEELTALAEDTMGESIGSNSDALCLRHTQIHSSQ